MDQRSAAFCAPRFLPLFVNGPPDFLTPFSYGSVILLAVTFIVFPSPFPSIMPPSTTKKSSITRRFTELINQKTATRRPSSRDGAKEGGSSTPPLQTITPSSSSSSPQSMQSTITSSSQSTRYTFDEQRLPVTFLPFVTTDTPFIKGLDVFGDSKGSPKSSFEFNEQLEDCEDNWFMSDDGCSEFDTLESGVRSKSKTTLQSRTKPVRIGWVCEDGFKPIDACE